MESHQVRHQQADPRRPGDLAVVRNALNLYSAEHTNTYPTGTSTQIIDKLTKYSSVSGATSDTKDATYKYGPYLLAFPACPVGENAGSNTILVDTTNNPPTVVTTGGEGWVYNSTSGVILPNTTTTDETGKAYNTY